MKKRERHSAENDQDLNYQITARLEAVIVVEFESRSSGLTEIAKSSKTLVSN